MHHPTLRIARPTANLAALLPFYRDGLGLQVLYEFSDHDGFDGVMLGHPQAPYHFEFTQSHSAFPASSEAHGRAPSQDNLLVFYLPDKAEWEAMVGRMQKAGFEAVKAVNPYWDRLGRTFEDPEGWRTVLQGAQWGL